MFTMKKIIIILLLFTPIFLATADSFTIWGPGGVNCEPGECNFCHLAQVVARTIEYVTTRLVRLLAVVLFLWAGILFIFSAGSPDKISRGKKVITYTIIGMIIVYTAYIIVGLFLGVFNVGEGWYNIGC